MYALSEIKDLHADDDYVYVDDSVKILPQFVGGDEILKRFTARNLRYPKEAAKQKIQGRVIVRFVVSKDGKIKDAKVIKKVHYLLDQEALRIINSMPDWSPGSINDKPVNVFFTVPINFRLRR